MNKIIIKNDHLDNYEDEFITIHDKKITFKKNGDYTLEYINSTNIQLTLDLQEHVFLKLFIFSTENDLLVNNHYQLAEYSQLLLFQFYHNKSVQEKIEVDLNGAYSRFTNNFSSISCGKEEYHMIVNHQNHHVESTITNKCIGLDNSKIHFQIDSKLPKGNGACQMNQETRILTLGDVDALVTPNMFIEEDSVEARHGTVIGSFAEDDIFYLMSRGISREESILLLTKGFLFSNLVVDLEKRSKIFACIQKIWR